MYWLFPIIKQFEERSDIIIRCSTLDVGRSMFSLFDVHLAKQFRYPAKLPLTVDKIEHF